MTPHFTPGLRHINWQRKPLRPYSRVDGQKFRINRGTAQRNNRGTTSFVANEQFWREATCQEVNCPAAEKGFRIDLDLSPMQDPEDLSLNRARYNYIRDKSGRSYEEKWDGSSVTFFFAAGQRCFKPHKLPLERDPVFIVNTGRSPSRAVDYDEFFDTFNETSYWLGRRKQGG